MQEHVDLESRIAAIIKGVEESEKQNEAQPPPPKHRKRDKQQFQTKPYNDGGEDEPIMDDEELHSLLGV